MDEETNREKSYNLIFRALFRHEEFKIVLRVFTVRSISGIVDFVLAIDFLSEEKFTTNELAKKAKLHPSMIRKLFIDEPGVVRVGHEYRGDKRQYFKLLIPASVAQRVFGRMTVGARGR